MIPTSELQQRLAHVEETIHRTAQVCQSESAVSMDLKDSIQQLDQQSERIRDLVLSPDEKEIRQVVDQLEELGDRARDACVQDDKIDSGLKSSVLQVHRELSDLKRALH
jgi:hypothetical protein